MNKPQRLDAFVLQVRRRLNRQWWWRTLRVALLVGAGAMVAIGLGYLGRGHAVPMGWYPLILAFSLAGAAVVWWVRRWTDEQAELYADRFFNLSDAISSRRGLEREGRHGAFHDLHAQQVEQWIARLDAQRIRPRPARGMIAGIVVLVGVAAALGFKGPSEEVRQQRAEAEHIREQTERINHELKSHVRRLTDALEGDEVELIDADRLREWVDRLEQREERAEALRQYARFEQEIRRQSAELRRERDEALLQRAAAALKADHASRELGRKLEQKEYAEAAEELERDRPDDLVAQDDLERERTKLDRLRAAAARMAAAAREFRQRRGPADGENGDLRQASERATGEHAALDDQEMAELDELLEALERELEAYDQALAMCEAGGEPGDEQTEALRLAQQAGDEAGERLARLTERLRSLDAAQLARQRLAQLRQRVGQEQSQLSSALAQAQRLAAGGREAGVGTDGNPMDNEADTPAEGRLTRLEGQKGEGPSLTTVEAADSGTGVSTRRTGEIDVEFQQEVESFVERSDVPQPVREGVKHYFKQIHHHQQRQADHDPDG